jgi:hypothetical protein
VAAWAKMMAKIIENTKYKFKVLKCAFKEYDHKKF